eukprot:TRINITY_DN92027_c0_g1_i2.p3 TRINITY_DN92027_c0_g1~~TRINITY_DN92027_c0_g1_i2.p3  ORF type:complete len:124 (+),score=35.17 TRINITY_DN92027_c0_g1_i2:176-547(+)
MGRGNKRKRGQSGGLEDQYGEVKGEDYGDRLNVPSFGGGSMRGGGSGGGPSRTGAARSITYERHVPKFLQQYAHLMDAKKNPFDSRHKTMREAAEQLGVKHGHNEDEFDEADDGVRLLFRLVG